MISKEKISKDKIPVLKQQIIQPVRNSISSANLLSLKNKFKVLILDPKVRKKVKKIANELLQRLEDIYFILC